MTASGKRKARVGRRRCGEQGLTLIELLLSLAILAVLTGFLAGGLSIGRRAFSADRVAEITSETDTGIQSVVALIGSALPIHTADQKSGIMFEGRQQTLSFVGLSEGRSQKGGPHGISFRRSGGDFIVEVAASLPVAAPEKLGSNTTRVVALRGVREVHFSYFGSLKSSGLSVWQADWIRSERLPKLVSILIEFEDARRNEPARIIALRQG